MLFQVKQAFLWLSIVQELSQRTGHRPARRKQGRRHFAGQCTEQKVTLTVEAKAETVATCTGEFGRRWTRTLGATISTELPLLSATTCGRKVSHLLLEARDPSPVRWRLGSKSKGNQELPNLLPVLQVITSVKTFWFRKLATCTKQPNNVPLPLPIFLWSYRPLYFGKVIKRGTNFVTKQEF